MIRVIVGSLVVLSLQGCGVRGDPIPPKTPAEMGRGKPNFERASEDLDFSEEDIQYKKRKKKNAR